MNVSTSLGLIPWLICLIDPVNLVGQEERTAWMKQAETLRCFFEAGHKFEWRDGKPLSIETNDADTVVFDQIDREAGHARAISSHGVGDVRVVTFDPGFVSIYGLTFIEATGFGNVNMTSVWAPAESDSYPLDPRVYPAVFSHHHAVDKPAPAQYPGWCRIEE